MGRTRGQGPRRHAATTAATGLDLHTHLVQVLGVQVRVAPNSGPEADEVGVSVGRVDGQPEVRAGRGAERLDHPRLPGACARAPGSGVDGGHPENFRGEPGKSKAQGRPVQLPGPRAQFEAAPLTPGNKSGR